MEIPLSIDAFNAVRAGRRPVNQNRSENPGAEPDRFIQRCKSGSEALQQHVEFLVAEKTPASRHLMAILQPGNAFSLRAEVLDCTADLGILSCSSNPLRVRQDTVFMDIVAIIACRNEELYLANCLQHLLDNGISFAIIDNDSTDGTAELVKSPKFRKGLVEYKSLPFNGVFELRSQLAAKEQIADRLGADWVIHHDADEVMHSYHHGETIHDAIARLAATGANVINFDEFVFLPIDNVYMPGSGWQLMRHYYFFQPAPHRLMRAWNRYDGRRMVVRDGHTRAGETIRVAGESLVLRHYIFRSQAHAYQKYTLRSFSDFETRELGWHLNRINQPIRSFTFPSAVSLQTLDDPRSCALSRARPRTKHYWQWEACSSEHAHGSVVGLERDPRLRRFGTA